jgi:ABC-type uncharacterized transport system permease subunit
MSNEHYLIASYFVVGFVSLALGVAAYRVLRQPFAAVAEATAGRRATLLKRTLALSLVLAAILGFISVNYRACGKSYDDVVKDRDYLQEINRQQLQHASNWIVAALFASAFLVVILLAIRRRKNQE